MPTPIDAIRPHTRNPRRIASDALAKLRESIQRDPEFMRLRPIVIDADGQILGGNQRWKACKALGFAELPDGWVVKADDLTDEQRRRFILVDNAPDGMAGGWDFDLLKTDWNLPELKELGFEMPDVGEQGGEGQECQKLSDRFLIPPFSVFNAREGWWQDRKRAWLGLGIKSELGRGENTLGFSDVANAGGYKKVDEYKKAKAFGAEGNIAGAQTGTSIFDPVLCEIAYRWFSSGGGTILDPFAGGSVRGIVAAKLGRRYIGHELRGEQVEANREQAGEICADDDLPPVWICGDSRGIDKTCADVEADMVFSCPPYADLEKYSEDPQDISSLAYADFVPAYREIVAKACARLKNDRFACFVVGEVRDRRGNYYDFVGDTVQAFRDAGLEYYNEAILVTAIGSLPIRVGKQFTASRKLGKTHQNVLVFVKGDGKRAAKNCGEMSLDNDALERYDIGHEEKGGADS